MMRKIVGACLLAAALISGGPASAAETRRFVIFFAFNQSEVVPDGQTVAQQAADYAKGAAHVTVVGYTDTFGPSDYNLGLSERRAQAVGAALADFGLPTGAVSLSWKGETELAVPTADEVREPQNRRAVITVSF